MLNKFLALILSLCLVIACGLFMASCGGGSDSDTDTAVSDTDSNTDTDSGTDSSSGNIEDVKAQTSKQLNENWNQLLLYFPDLCNSTEYGEEFTKLLMRVNNATTQKDLEKIMMSFNEMAGKIRDNFTFDFNAYKKDAITYANRYWNELLTRYPDVANNAEYTKRHDEAFDKIDAADNEKDLETAINVLYNLVEEISNYYNNQGGEEKPDDLASAKEEMTTGLQNEWANLSRLYPDLKSSVYAKTYAGLLNDIGKATAVNELSGIWEQFYDLIEDINQNLTPDVNEYKIWAKENIENDWANLINRFADLNNDEEIKSRYNSILTGIKDAATKENVDEILNTYNRLLNDIYKKYDGGQETPDITEEQKQNLINHLENEWKKLTSMSEEIAKKYSEKYNELLNRAQNVTTSAEINNIQAEFKNLSDIIQKEFSGGDVSSYKEQVKSQIESRWQEFLSRFGSMEDTDFPTRYEEIKNSLESAMTMSEIDSVSQDFETLAQEVESRANLNGTINMHQMQIDESLDYLKQNYQDKFTDEINAKIAALREKLNASETVTDAYTNYQAVIEYLNQLEEGFASQPTMDEIIQVKSLVTSMREKVLEEYNNTYSEFGEDVSAKETALLQEIDNVNTRRQLEEIKNKIETEYLAYLEKEALNFAIAKIKQTVNDSYNTSPSSTEKEAFRDQVLYVVENCKNAEDIKHYYFYTNDMVGWVFQDSYGLMEGYIELTSFYIGLFENEVVTAATKKIDVPESLDDLVGYVKGAENTEQAAKRFAEIKAAFESVKDMVYAKKAELNTILGMEKKLGVTSDELIAEIISQVKVIGNYSDGSTKEFSLTADMLSFNNVNFAKIGNYSIEIHFKNEDFEVYSNAYVMIVPDMENATVVGTYNSTGYFLQDIDMGGSVKMTLYSNGYLSFSEKYNGYFLYTDKGDYIEVEFGEHANCSVGLFTLDKTKNTFDYYYPAGDLIVTFTAWRTEFIFKYIWVYGNYTTAGKYVAICNYGITTSEDGRYIGWPTYCTLDMENKKFSSVWMNTLKVGEEGAPVYTWEENGHDFDLTEDLTEVKAEAKKQVKEMWDELVQKGYDVSYMENNGYNYNSVISGIDTALDRSVINDLLMNFRNYADMMKKNHFNSSYSFTEPTAQLNVGDSIDTFIEKNLVGKTFEASLEYGTGVTVTITKDMVTYNGDTSTSHSINFTISYEHELYGHIDFSFTVWVNPVL